MRNYVLLAGAPDLLAVVIIKATRFSCFISRVAFAVSYITGTVVAFNTPAARISADTDNGQYEYHLFHTPKLTQ